MKKRYLSFVLLLTVLASCSKKENVSPFFFSCTIEGNKYTIENEIGAYAVVFSNTSNTIYGTELENVKTATPRTMYITLESTKGVGVHQCNGKNAIFFEDTDKVVYRTNFNNGSGQIEITEKTAEVIKGRFSGIAKSFTNPIKTINITSGEFSVRFR
ncbi:hypothetical protein [Runella aurantiaca]|nr:hypothetical protein [Runella aurantiaca]